MNEKEQHKEICSQFGTADLCNRKTSVTFSVLVNLSRFAFELVHIPMGKRVFDQSFGVLLWAIPTSPGRPVQAKGLSHTYWLHHSSSGPDVYNPMLLQCLVSECRSLGGNSSTFNDEIVFSQLNTTPVQQTYESAQCFSIKVPACKKNVFFLFLNQDITTRFSYNLPQSIPAGGFSSRFEDVVVALYAGTYSQNQGTWDLFRASKGTGTLSIDN